MLTRTQRMGWGLADMGVVPFVIVKQLLVFEFLTRGLAIPVDVAGFVTSGVLVFDVITDPIIGWLSDRTRSRWGRRLPWMVAGAPVMVLGTWALFQAPVGGVIWVAVFFGLGSVGFTMIAIPYSASAAEITNSPTERSALTAWRMGFASLGLLIGGGAIPALQGALGYGGAVLAMTPLILGAVWGSAWMIRRAPMVAAPSVIPWSAQIRIVLGTPAFVVLMVGYGVMTMAIGILTAGLAYAASDLVVVAPSGALAAVAGALGVLPLLFAAFVVGALISQPLWAGLSVRWGKLPVLVAGLFVYGALLVWIGGSIQGMTVESAALLFVAAGLCNGVYQQVPWALFPDLIRPGSGVEGGYSAMWLLGQKVGNAVGPAALGVMLAAAGWVEGRGVTQTPDALAALARAMTVVPAAVLVLAAVAMAVVLPRVRR